MLYIAGRGGFPRVAPSGVPGGAIASVAIEWRLAACDRVHRGTGDHPHHRKKRNIGRETYVYIYIYIYIYIYYSCSLSMIFFHACFCQPLLLCVIRKRSTMDMSGRRLFQLGNPDLLSRRVCALNVQGSPTVLCTDLGIRALRSYRGLDVGRRGQPDEGMLSHPFVCG